MLSSRNFYLFITLFDIKKERFGSANGILRSGRISKKVDMSSQGLIPETSSGQDLNQVQDRLGIPSATPIKGDYGSTP